MSAARFLVCSLAWLCPFLATPASAQLAAYDLALTECAPDEPMFRSGLEPAELVGVRPSGGAWEVGPDADILDVQVTQTGRIHRAYMALPPGYSPLVAAPVVVVLHGAAGSDAAADQAAQTFRDFWTAPAAGFGAIVITPVASGASGGWVPSLDGRGIACLLAEAERRYNIDRSRRYIWGFSAGAHYGHALALGNASRFAAYAVKAGALGSLVCSPYTTSEDCADVLMPVPRRIPAQLRVGGADPLRNYTGADAASFALAGWVSGVDLQASQVSGGHQVGAADASAAIVWFSQFVRP